LLWVFGVFFRFVFGCVWCCLGTVQPLFCFRGWACGLWGVGAVFLVCISAPFGMIGVVSGAFSGSFRVLEGFSGSDA
jgi:hypothetical protein